MIHLTASNFEIEARDSDLPVVVMFKGREIESIMQGVLEKNVFEERVRELL